MFFSDPSNKYRTEVLIEESNGLDNLESLQHHESERIYQLAYKIVDEFFNEEDSDVNVEVLTDKNVVTGGMDTNSAEMTYNF